MHTQQMELGFGSAAVERVDESGKRTGRAEWWFRQMRGVVDRALEWPSMQPPRLERTRSGFGKREVNG